MKTGKETCIHQAYTIYQALDWGYIFSLIPTPESKNQWI